jgi:hypothetical protein
MSAFRAHLCGYGDRAFRITPPAQSRIKFLDFDKTSDDTIRADEARLPALELDYDEYLPMMADIEISEDQKREFLETLASILRGFVEMGFNLSDADICGWIAEDGDQSLPTDSEGVSSEPSTDIAKESAQGGGE